MKRGLQVTRNNIEEIVKRYKEIKKAIKAGKRTAKFYAGGKKHSIEIAREVRTVFKIIEEIEAREEAEYMKEMIKSWKEGESDRSIIMKSPLSRNAYYERKREFINKIFACSIYRGMVSYEEIMEEKIGKEKKEADGRTKEKRDGNIALDSSQAYRALRGIEIDKVE